MTLKGIDISNWQGWPLNAKAKAGFDQSDFVIVKATQGLNFVSKTCDPQWQAARTAGKMLGHYHYAGGNDPVAEADYFVNNTMNYFHASIPVLDWESSQNKAWGQTDWAARFANRVHERAGVWPMIYVQASAIGQVASCANNCALWVAGYPDNRDNWTAPAFTYNIVPWHTYTVWQYTSSGGSLDRNVAQLDVKGWLRIAEGQKGAGIYIKPATNAGIAVDGKAGKATITKWQQVMKTPVDGIVSGQSLSLGRKYRPNLLSVTYGTQGSNLIRAVQKALGVSIDGQMGPQTIKALQAHLGVPADGIFGPKTVYALQAKLNTGSF